MAAPTPAKVRASAKAPPYGSKLGPRRRSKAERATAAVEAIRLPPRAASMKRLNRAPCLRLRMGTAPAIRIGARWYVELGWAKAAMAQTAASRPAVRTPLRSCSSERSMSMTCLKRGEGRSLSPMSLIRQSGNFGSLASVAGDNDNWIRQ